MIELLKNPQNRKYIYGIVTALIPILVATGLILPGISDLIVALVAAVLGLGSSALATANTHPDDDTRKSTDVDSQYEAGDSTDEADRIPEGR